MKRGNLQEILVIHEGNGKGYRKANFVARAKDRSRYAPNQSPRSGPTHRTRGPNAHLNDFNLVILRVLIAVGRNTEINRAKTARYNLCKILQTIITRLR
jgi:hypothetical protein